jgi:hypothetical protein
MLCPRCSAPLGVLPGPGRAGLACPNPDCATPFDALLFPALFEAGAAPELAAPALEAEASCFFHAEKKAVQSCQSCGRFVCALCDLELAQKHYCPSCLETGRDAELGRRLEKGRVRWDKAALTLALFASSILWFFSFVAAPAVLFISLRNFNKPLTVVDAPGVKRGIRLRFGLAILLSLGQLAGWGLFIIHLLRR